MLNKPYILIYGYGNPGRQDDAAGLMLTENIENWSKQNNLPIECYYNYQLNIEDSYKIKNYKLTIFVDSTINEEIYNFNFTKISASPDYDFSTHIIKPQYLLYLTETLFDYKIEAYVLEIKGYQWELMQQPTENVYKNIEFATEFLKNFIKNYLVSNQKIT